jgi:hypothetical protein
VRLDRHLRSFVKGATGAGAASDGALLATPAQVKARATRTLKRILLLQLVWFGCFLAGGVLVLESAWHNNHLPASCSASRPAAEWAATAGCLHHSFLWPALLILLGIAGLLVTGYVATRLAVKYMGAGAVAFLRGGRGFMGPMAPPDGQDMGSGFPGSTGGTPPGFTAGLPPGFTAGLPPGPPGPPLDPPSS